MKNRCRSLLILALLIVFSSTSCSFLMNEDQNSMNSGGVVNDTFCKAFSQNFPPVVSGVADNTYEAGISNITLEWLATDANPDNYTIYEDEIVVDTDSWISGQTINYSVGIKDPGVYNFTILVGDTLGLTNVDTVILTYEDTYAPFISGPDPYDIQIYEGDFYWANFTINDKFPKNYTLFINGSVEDSGPLSTQVTKLNYSLDGRGLGNHNYTMLVYDHSNHSTVYSVILTVIDGISTDIDHPDDVTFELGADEAVWWNVRNFFEWDYPGSYWIYRNGTLVVSDGIWNVEGTIAYWTQSLDIGIYNITVVAFDASGNDESDSVWVTIQDTTSPDISSPDDIVLDEGTTGNAIVWTCFDFDPHEYQILINSVTQGLTTWSGENITYSLDALDYGQYNISLTLFDSSGNVASDSVTVTVQDTTAPVIEEIESTGIWSAGTSGNNITFSASDMNPESYIVYINGTIYKEGLWNSTSETVVIFLDHLDVGVYNVTVSVLDIAGNEDHYTMWVEVGPPVEVVPMEMVLAFGIVGAVGVVIVVVFLLKKKSL